MARPAGQDWDPDRYDRTASYITDHGRPLIDLLDPRPGERVLDLGCGTGVLSREIAARGADVVGVDASPEQVAATCAAGVDARVMDAAQLTFEAEFDAVFSNAALHWVTDQDAAIDGIARALKPGGRVVAEMGGAGNIRVLTGALLDALAACGVDGRAHWPWVFPDPNEQRRRLEKRGFDVESMEHFPRATSTTPELGDWLLNFAGAFLAALPESERPALISEVERRLAPKLRGADGIWVVDNVRLRFVAVRP